MGKLKLSRPANHLPQRMCREFTPLSSATRQRRFAVNLPLDESRTASMSPDELARLGVPLQTTAEFPVVATLERQRHLQQAELENRQKLWRWAIAGVLMVTLAEIMFSRLARAPRTNCGGINLMESRLQDQLGVPERNLRRVRLWRRLAFVLAADGGRGTGADSGPRRHRLEFAAVVVAGIDWRIDAQLGSVWRRERRRPKDYRALVAVIAQENPEVRHLLSA